MPHPRVRNFDGVNRDIRQESGTVMRRITEIRRPREAAARAVVCGDAGNEVE